MLFAPRVGFRVYLLAWALDKAIWIGGVIPSFLRRGGCASNKMSRTPLLTRRGFTRPVEEANESTVQNDINDRNDCVCRKSRKRARKRAEDNDNVRAVGIAKTKGC